jgi:hypothetical protein
MDAERVPLRQERRSGTKSGTVPPALTPAKEEASPSFAGSGKQESAPAHHRRLQKEASRTTTLAPRIAKKHFLGRSAMMI